MLGLRRRGESGRRFCSQSQIRLRRDGRAASHTGRGTELVAVPGPAVEFRAGRRTGGCAVFAAIVGYQNLVQMPALRAQIEQTNLTVSGASDARVSAERGGEPLALSKSTPSASITVAHEWDDRYTRYRVELRRQGGPIVAHSTLTAPAKGDLVIDLRTSAFEEGRYTLLIYGLREGQSANTPIGRIPIVITK